jgi:type VI protein secretion system component VasA
MSTDALQIRNITRVTAPRPVALGERLPWRVNAYARMPAARFAEAASLAAFLDVHDVTGARRTSRLNTDPAAAGVTSARRELVRRVEGDEVLLGDQLDLTLDERVFGGGGATWLVGELLARALAERADFVRFTRTRLVDEDGAVGFDYGNRRGQRLPPPFG